MRTIIAEDKLIEIKEKAKEMQRTKHPKPEELPEHDKDQLLQKLEIHQIELELQNEELVLAQNEVRQVAKKYTALYNAAPIGFLTLSSDGRIMEHNTFAAKLLGNEPNLTGEYFDKFVHALNIDVYKTFLRSVYEHPDKQEAEIMIQPEKSSDKPLYFNLTGIVTDGNECLITAEDFTHRKLAMEATIQTQRLSAIGEMTSSIAHDFNNSLQSMLGNLELAMQASQQDNVGTYLNTIKKSVIEAIARVRQLQRFGTIEKESSIYNIVDINSLTEEVIAQLLPLWKDEAEAKGISIRIETNFGNIPEICGNVGELRNAFFNIIKNGIEAMPLGGTLKVETGNNSKGIYVTITDTGVGMNEESKSKIFQPFYSTKGFNLGRGLGMSTAHTVIKEHHGKIYVKNTIPGQGTSIEVMFPVHQAIPLAQDIKANDYKQNDTLPIRKPYILWVDDDDDIRAIVKEMLKQLGSNIDMASGAKEAIGYMDKNKYDVVVTDIGMPEMNGWQLAEVIRLKFGPDMKIAVASGWGAQIKEKDLEKHGIYYMLEKPFTIAKLREFLETIKQEAEI